MKWWALHSRKTKEVLAIELLFASTKQDRDVMIETEVGLTLTLHACTWKRSEESHYSEKRKKHCLWQLFSFLFHFSTRFPETVGKCMESYHHWCNEYFVLTLLSPVRSCLFTSFIIDKSHIYFIRTIKHGELLKLFCQTTAFVSILEDQLSPQRNAKLFLFFPSPV